MKTEINMTKINLRYTKPVYQIMIPVIFLVVINYIFSLAVPGSEGNTTLAAGNYLFLFPILMAVFVPAKNFSKLMNLGGNRKNFFRSCFLLYAILSAAASLFSILLHYTVDPIILTKITAISDLFNAFGFLSRGVITAFFQMTAFLILVSCFFHTFTLIQGHWYGWLIDLLIIIILSVFIPIEPLRQMLILFFNLIVFHTSAIVQIVSCLILGTLIYTASLPSIKAKII